MHTFSEHLEMIQFPNSSRDTETDCEKRESVSGELGAHLASVIAGRHGVDDYTKSVRNQNHDWSQTFKFVSKTYYNSFPFTMTVSNYILNGIISPTRNPSRLYHLVPE